MLNLIKNMFIGGWCGDAIGSKLEFYKRRFTMDEINDAIVNCAGKVTDDTEMEVAMLSALSECVGTDRDATEAIAAAYIQWITNPSDVGRATRLAISGAKNASEMVTNAIQFNGESESNGSMMRCVPIVWYFVTHGKSDNAVEEIIRVARIDASLTHPSEVVKVSTAAYCVALYHGLCIQDAANDNVLKKVEAVAITNPTVHAWYKLGLFMDDIDTYDCINREGHVKHAFVMMVYFLNKMKKYTYESGIRQVLSMGGDTDTNTKIIGSLLGVFHMVPQKIKDRIADNETVKKGLRCLYADSV